MKKQCKEADICFLFTTTVYNVQIMINEKHILEIYLSYSDSVYNFKKANL